MAEEASDDWEAAADKEEEEDDWEAAADKEEHECGQSVLQLIPGTTRWYRKRSTMFVEILEPLLAFLAANRPFAAVSRLAVVSPTWRRVSLNALKSAHELNLSGFAESVTDGVVRLALVRVTSENLRVVNLTGCHRISAGGMENILQYIAVTCSGVKEVDVTACSNETVLRAVATRARAALGASLALDLFALLRSLGEEGMRYSFSNLSSLLHSSPPLLLFHPALAPRKDALLQAAAHGTGSDVAMLLSLAFAVGDDIRTFDVNEKDSRQEGNTPLLLACRSGNFEIAEMLVTAGAGVRAANYRGDTPLLAAVEVGKLELAKMLVSKGADVNTKGSEGNSPLLLACRSGNFEMAEMIVSKGADVNKKDWEGNSLLLLACKSGNYEIAEMLVVAGAGVRAANRRGDTPLLAAVGAGNLALAEMLVSKGANVNAKGSYGNSPLLLACRSGNFEMAEMLVCAGAGVSAANERGDTPLLAAVGAGKLEFAEMLVSKGANVVDSPDPMSGDGCREMAEMAYLLAAPLSLACRSGNFEMAEMLVSKGAGMNFYRPPSVTPNRWSSDRPGSDEATLPLSPLLSPLLAAVGAGKLELAEMLVSKGARVWGRDSEGNTPLLLACRSGNFEMAEMLVVAADKSVVAGPEPWLYRSWHCRYEWGYECVQLVSTAQLVSAANKGGDTPLLAAVGAGKLEFAEMLVSKGADVNEEDSEGNTPLLLTCRSGNFEMSEMLVSKGADVNAKDSEGNSLLLLACRSGNFEMAEMLVVAGAGVSAANKRRDTPLLAAVEVGKLELAKMLVSKGANVEAVRMDGAGLLSLALVSQQAELLNLALTCSPRRLEHQDVMSVSELAAAFLHPARITADRIEGWLRTGASRLKFDPVRITSWLTTGASPLGLADQVGALIASCALDSSTKNRLEDLRAFLLHNSRALTARLTDYSVAEDQRLAAWSGGPSRCSHGWRICAHSSSTILARSQLD
jgi:ankyrin repeat protein